MFLELDLIYDRPSSVMTRHLRHHREKIIVVERIWEIWNSQHAWMSCARSIGGKREKKWHKEVLYIYPKTGHGAKFVNKDHTSGQIGQQLGWYWNDGQVQTHPASDKWFSPLHCSTWHTQHGRQHSARFSPNFVPLVARWGLVSNCNWKLKIIDSCKRLMTIHHFRLHNRHIRKFCWFTDPELHIMLESNTQVDSLWVVNYTIPVQVTCINDSTWRLMF